MQSGIVCTTGTLEVWNWATKRPDKVLQLEGDFGGQEEERALLLHYVAVSCEGRSLMACGTLATEAHLWCIITGGHRQTFVGHTLPITAVALSASGALAAAASENATVRVWSTITGDCTFTFREHTKVVTCLAFFPLNNTVASGALDCTVRIWCPEGESRKLTLESPAEPCRGEAEIASWEIQPQGVLCLDLAPETGGAQLASGLEGGFVVVYDGRTGERGAVWQAHDAGVGHVLFSPCGTVLATAASHDGPAGAAKLWSPGDGSCLRVISRKLLSLSGLGFLAADTPITVQSFPNHGAVKLWGAETGRREMGERQIHDAGVCLILPWPSNRLVALWP